MKTTINILLIFGLLVLCGCGDSNNSETEPAVTALTHSELDSKYYLQHPSAWPSTTTSGWGNYFGSNSGQVRISGRTSSNNFRITEYTITGEKTAHIVGSGSSDILGAILYLEGDITFLDRDFLDRERINLDVDYIYGRGGISSIGIGSSSREYSWNGILTNIKD